MLNLITYADKVALNENTEVAEINKVTAGNMNEIKDVINAIADTIYPVGITVCFYDNKDHSDFCGGTWVRTSTGKMPIGYDNSDTDFNTIGKTGGSKTQSFALSDNGYACLNLNWEGKIFGRSINTSLWEETFLISTGKYREASSSTSGLGIALKGSTDSASILSPYEVFAFWRRTA